MIQQEFSGAYTATAATASVTTGRIVLHTVSVPKLTVGTLSFQDVNNNVYFAMPTGVAANTYTYDMVLNNGLQIVQGSASDQVVTTYQH